MTEHEKNQEPLNEERVPPRPEKKENSLWELIKFALLAVAIVIPIRAFVAQPFIVSGLSMFPTFHDGDYLIVDEISYRFEDPARGDVVIFRYPKDPSKFFIKRIIGLPGEELILSGEKIRIKNAEHPEGFELAESYVKNISTSMTDITLGADQYFVMGDNRSASSDSRAWGTLPKNLITGRALVRLLPIKDIEFFPGEANY